MLACLCGHVSAGNSPPSIADTKASNSDRVAAENLKTLRAILSQPENRIDLARAKLTIDQMIDPTVDAESVLKQIDMLASDVRAHVPLTASSEELQEALRSYIYQAGAWNGDHPFRYDLEDPFGRNVKNKLLTTYLRTRKGNCVSMPILYLLVGRKLGLDLSLAKVPTHYYLIFHYAGEKTINMETTTGGYKLDSSYRRDLPMTDEALMKGLYMRPLNARETVIEMVEALSQFYAQQDRANAMISLADLAMEYSPRDAEALVQKGYAYSVLLEQEYKTKYASPMDIPLAERQLFVEKQQRGRMWYKKAEAMGWRQPSEAQEEKYVQSVENAKERQ